MVCKTKRKNNKKRAVLFYIVGEKRGVEERNLKMHDVVVSWRGCVGRYIYMRKGGRTIFKWLIGCCGC